jgi:hypothetical protein
MRIVRATIVSDPSIVLGVHVRNVRVASLVHFHVVFGRGLGFPASCRGTRRRGSPRGSGTVSGNVPAANRLVTAALWRPTASALLPTALRKSSHAN